MHHWSVGRLQGVDNLGCLISDGLVLQSQYQIAQRLIFGFPRHRFLAPKYTLTRRPDAFWPLFLAFNWALSWGQRMALAVILIVMGFFANHQFFAKP